MDSAFGLPSKLLRPGWNLIASQGPREFSFITWPASATYRQVLSPAPALLSHGQRAGGRIRFTWMGSLAGDGVGSNSQIALYDSRLLATVDLTPTDGGGVTVNGMIEWTLYPVYTSGVMTGAWRLHRVVSMSTGSGVTTVLYTPAGSVVDPSQTTFELRHLSLASSATCHQYQASCEVFIPLA